MHTKSPAYNNIIKNGIDSFFAQAHLIKSQTDERHLGLAKQ